MIVAGLLLAFVSYASALPQATTVASSARSTAAVASGSASGSRSASAAPGATYTVPIDFLAQFATASSLLPSVKSVAASASAASGSGSASARPAAGATFTGVGTISGGSAQVTYIAQPTAFVAIEGAVLSAASISAVAAETCVFNSTLTSTVIPGKGPVSAVSASGSRSGSASGAPTPLATTVTGYRAACAFNEQGRAGSASLSSTSNFAAIAVPATLGSDGRFTWLSTVTLRNATATAAASASSRSGSASPSSSR